MGLASVTSSEPKFLPFVALLPLHAASSLCGPEGCPTLPQHLRASQQEQDWARPAPSPLNPGGVHIISCLSHWTELGHVGTCQYRAQEDVVFIWDKTWGFSY